MIEHLNTAEMETIVDLARIAQALETPLMLVGANARRLSFDIPFSFVSPRTTQDWDFAAPMPNWDTYVRFQQLATEGPEAKFRPGENAHRIVHLRACTLVDLIPFGGVSDGEGRICWPQSQQVMSVVGFEEAYASSIKETLSLGMEISFVTPAMLAALKIVAFAERQEEYSRDLQDLWFIMERYARPAAHEMRVFEELAEHFPDLTYYEHLNSLLLGWDIGRNCRPATLAAMDVILLELACEQSQQLSSLLMRTGDLEEQHAQLQKITGEFGWLRTGIAIGRTTKSPSSE